MAEIRSIGLKYIKIGDPEQDGGMGQTLAALGVTYQDTAELTREDPEITNINSEENDDPEEVIETPGARRIRWSIMNVDPVEVAKIMGGTSDGDIYKAPDAAAPVEKSIEILTKTNLLIQIPRVKLYAKENFQFRKKNVLLIDIEGTVLKPNKENEPTILWQKVTGDGEPSPSAS